MTSWRTFSPRLLNFISNYNVIADYVSNHDTGNLFVRVVLLCTLFKRSNRRLGIHKPSIRTRAKEVRHRFKKILATYVAENGGDDGKVSSGWKIWSTRDDTVDLIARRLFIAAPWPTRTVTNSNNRGFPRPVIPAILSPAIFRDNTTETFASGEIRYQSKFDLSLENLDFAARPTLAPTIVPGV